MKRLLIALLALMTGLAVQAAPATARAPGLAIGAKVDASAAICAAKAARNEQVAVVASQVWPPIEAAQGPAFSPIDAGEIAPTVRYGPDRARE